jgi:hypothetical protein
MGLEIRIHCIKKTHKNSEAIDNSDWAKISKSQEEQDMAKFKRTYLRAINILKGIDSDAYAAEYTKQIKKLCKLCDYPRYDLKELGVGYDIQKEKHTYTPVPVEKFEDNFERILKDYVGYYTGYFRKVNTVYAYFLPKLTDERGWITKEDCEDIVYRCDKVLKDHSLASSLLPTQGGFLFGSTEYDKYYFKDLKDVRKQFKSFLKYFKKPDTLVYIVMSW